MLQLAVRNRHNECLEILIRDGRARLDKKGGPYVQLKCSYVCTHSFLDEAILPCMNAVSLG